MFVLLISFTFQGGFDRLAQNIIRICLYVYIETFRFVYIRFLKGSAPHCSKNILQRDTEVLKTV